MGSLIDVVGLGSDLDAAKISLDQRSNLEELSGSIVADARLGELRHAIEIKIKEYFDDIELPRAVTLYDELLLTLRRKDLIASFNWDPF